MEGIVQVIDLDKGIEIAPKFLNEEGKFKFLLVDQNNYLLVIQGDDFIRVEELFYLSGPQEVQVKAVRKSRKIEFESLEFPSSSAELSEPMRKDIAKIIDFMIEYPFYHLKISGHTDSKGAPERNLELSKLRARNIRNFIVEEHGIEADRVQHEGYGSTQPIIENEETAEDRSINRRVEFFLYYKE